MLEGKMTVEILTGGWLQAFGDLFIYLAILAIVLAEVLFHLDWQDDVRKGNFKRVPGSGQILNWKGTFLVASVVAIAIGTGAWYFLVWLFESTCVAFLVMLGLPGTYFGNKALMEWTLQKELTKKKKKKRKG